MLLMKLNMFFLNMNKKIRFAIAIVVVIFMAASSIFIYTSAFPLTDDRNVLSQAISDNYMKASGLDVGRGIEIYILETIETERGIRIFFRVENREQTFGFAFFQRAFFDLGYTLTESTLEILPYSAFVVANNYTGREPSVFFAGYNLRDVHSFGVELQSVFSGTGTMPSPSGWGNIEDEIIFQIGGEQFFEKVPMDIISALSPPLFSQILSWYIPSQQGTLYDAQGNDITSNFVIANAMEGQTVNFRSPPAINTSLIFSILLFGIIFIQFIFGMIKSVWFLR